LSLLVQLASSYSRTGELLQVYPALRLNPALNHSVRSLVAARYKPRSADCSTFLNVRLPYHREAALGRLPSPTTKAQWQLPNHKRPARPGAAEAERQRPDLTESSRSDSSGHWQRSTLSGRSGFSKPASQPNPDSANWNAPKPPLATSTYRPRRDGGEICRKQSSGLSRCMLSNVACEVPLFTLFYLLWHQHT
jgi:hypothetical protein